MNETGIRTGILDKNKVSDLAQAIDAIRLKGKNRESIIAVIGYVSGFGEDAVYSALEGRSNQACNIVLPKAARNYASGFNLYEAYFIPNNDDPTGNKPQPINCDIPGCDGLCVMFGSSIIGECTRLPMPGDWCPIHICKCLPSAADILRKAKQALDGLKDLLDPPGGFPPLPPIPFLPPLPLPVPVP